MSVLGCHFKDSYSAQACLTLRLCNPYIIDIQKLFFFCHSIFNTTARKGSFCTFAVLSATLGRRTGVGLLGRPFRGSGLHRFSRCASLWLSDQLIAQILTSSFCFINTRTKTTHFNACGHYRFIIFICVFLFLASPPRSGAFCALPAIHSVDSYVHCHHRFNHSSVISNCSTLYNINGMFYQIIWP